MKRIGLRLYVIFLVTVERLKNLDKIGMLFSYKAKKLIGEEISGEKEAADHFDLARLLRKEEYVLISWKELKPRASSFSFLGRLFGHVSAVEKIMFSRNLAVMIEAGLSLNKSLEVLSRQTRSKRFESTIKGITQDIQKGTSFSESLKKYPKIFSPLFQSMARAGEEAGKLAESLKIISLQLKRDHDLLRRIRGALVYPAIIFITMLGAGIIMLIYVVPTLVSTFKELEIELPLTTKIIIGLSELLLKQGFLILLIGVGIIALGSWWTRTKTGKRLFNTIFLYLPFVSPLVKKTNSARTARTLGSLIESGVDLVEALEVTREVLQNHHYKEVLEKAKTEIQKGAPIAAPFLNSPHLYPPLVGEMVAVGEETGKLGQMLGRLAIFYENEVALSTKDLSTVIEPFLMIVVGAIVGFFAVSMISPIYSSLGNL